MYFISAAKVFRHLRSAVFIKWKFATLIGLIDCDYTVVAVTSFADVTYHSAIDNEKGLMPHDGQC